MATHLSRALVRARSTNSKRLAILLAAVGVLGLVRLVAHPVPDAAFVLLAFWLSAGLVYDLGMRKFARVIPPEAAQTFMYALDVTLVAVIAMLATGSFGIG